MPLIAIPLDRFPSVSGPAEIRDQSPWRLLRPSACPLHDIPWRELARQSDRRLGDLLLMRGLFAAGRRAMPDCRSLLHILAQPLPHCGRVAVEVMLVSARRLSVTFFAEGAPFEKRTVLRARGYRWLDGAGGAPRYWMRQVSHALAPDEARFLFDEIHPPGDGYRLTMTLLSAVNRYRPIETIAAARGPLSFASRSRMLVAGGAS